jgi:hypothetical protein
MASVDRDSGVRLFAGYAVHRGWAGLAAELVFRGRSRDVGGAAETTSELDAAARAVALGLDALTRPVAVGVTVPDERVVEVVAGGRLDTRSWSRTRTAS